MPTLERRTEAVTADCGEVSTESLIQRLLREHRRWRSKDFPFIFHLFDEVQSAEGAPPPCLALLRKAFHRLCAEMEGHMTREEHVVFPAILDAHVRTGTYGHDFGSPRNPIAKIEEEHDWEAEGLEQMRKIAENYQLPENSHEKVRLLFRELEALEAGMHAHSHLESSILFARALATEKAPPKQAA